MESIFTPLLSKGLTTLHIRYNFRTGEFTYRAARDFEPELDFSRYNKDFWLTSLPSASEKYLGTSRVIEMFGKYGLTGYVDQILEQIRKGRHIGINFTVHERLKIRHICGIHSDVRGRGNKSFTTFAGATRRHELSKPELDVIKDALNLSRAMSFKNIAVNLPYGGAKTTLHMDPLDINDMEALGFLAYACDTTHCITGPDMNMPKEMVKVINERYTMQYCGGPGSALGDTAVPTALGAYLALKQAVRFVTGSESLDGMSIAVQGLGAVGYAMAHNLAGENTRLIITDVDKSRVDRFIAGHPKHDITPVQPETIIYADADILCPCAMGGILGEEEIKKLNARYVFGPANNQLRAGSQDEEFQLARLLAERGILFQTEWWHNGAGVLGAAMEYINGRDITVTPKDLEQKVREIIPANTWENLNRAKELGVTPTESAYLRCQDIIYA